MALTRSRSTREPTNYWPGFVDALSSLLLVIMFLLSMFVIVQFFLSQEILGRDSALSRLNSQIAELTEMLQLERTNAADLETNIATLAATLAGAEAKNAGLNSQLATLGVDGGDQQARIGDLNNALLAEQDLSAEAAAQVALLNQQLSALRTQIAALESALGAAEARDDQNRTSITDLGRRLNLALAKRVQDLARYRSDFFGRLREILEGRSDITIVGDRFVFQSEVLFDAGQGEVAPGGFAALQVVADAILELEKEIPSDIPWVLRIDGHTDRRPISTIRFPSNWELSAARAISVAKFMVEQGVPPYRLVAAGFGEFQPIDSADTEEAYRRNRRIEFKLTEN